MSEDSAPDGSSADTAGPRSTAADGRDELGSVASRANGACWSATPLEGAAVAFEETTDKMGLVEPLTGMYGHAIAAADVNEDHWTDLFVAGFADRPQEDYEVRGADGPAPDRLLLGGPEGFTLDDGFPGELARSSGAAFADLDADGDLDLVVVRNPRGDGEIGQQPTVVYEQEGSNWTLRASIAADVGGRSVAAIDVDRDGQLDLAIAGDRFGAGPSRLFRNEGGFEFSDSTDAWGMPADLETLAIAVVDLDGDGWLDLVSSGDTRVLIGGEGGFRIETMPVLEWELLGDEDDPAGIAVGDLDGDGRPDIVIGQHFNSTIDDDREVPIRVFANRSEPGDLELVDVTDDAGVPALWTKSPHVAVADLDNDGHPDIVTSAAADNGLPVILHNRGEDSLRFETLGDPGDGTYWVTGAIDDFDHDGRLDMFMMAWEPAAISPYFRNTGSAGRWVELDVTALGARAPDAVVRIGGADSTAWAQTTTGYAAGSPLVIRFGLGEDAADEVDMTIESVSGDRRELTVPVDAHSTLGDC